MATPQGSNTVFTPSGNPYLDCSQYDLSDLSTAYWIFIGATVIVNLALILLWYLKRDLFPLKERSPYLVMTSLLGNILVQISFPVVYIYEQTYDDPQPAVLYILWSLLPFGGVLFYMPYFWRAARLQHAFNVNKENKVWSFLFARQSVTILITVVCGVIYSAILLSVLQERSLEFYTEDNSNLNTHFASLAFMDFLKMGFMIIAAYELRFVKREYNFRTEITLAFFFLFVSFNMLFFIPFSDRNDAFSVNQGCNLIPYSTNMLISNIRNWLITGVTAIYPLFITIRAHYLLPQEFVINIFHNILGDETCIEAFDEYIRSGRKKSGTLLYTSAYEANDEEELFRVFMSLRKRIMQGKSSPKIIDRMMAEYVDNEKVAEFFPPAYIYELKREYRENKGAMTIESFDRLHGFCIYYFQDVFETRFKKTRSFQYIRDLFKKNEKINRKLHNLNLVSIR